MITVAVVDVIFAKEMARAGDLDGAVELARDAVERHFATGAAIFRAPVIAMSVDVLLCRGDDADVREAAAAVDRLAAIPTEQGFVLHEVWLLRLLALVAQARGDQASYCEYRDRYRAMAESVGYQGHLKWALEMA
jgi:adenylate cyclase